jgi:hypothetical protein
LESAPLTANDLHPRDDASKASVDISHVYPKGRLLVDALRGGMGLAATLTPLVFADVAVWVGWLLVGLSALFATFVLLTAYRARMKIVQDPDGIAVVRPWYVHIPWAQLEGFTLRYYALGAGAGQGWMQLTLKCGRSRIKAESRIGGFDELVIRGLQAARRNALPLSGSTSANLRALGVLHSGYETESMTEANTKKVPY